MRHSVERFRPDWMDLIPAMVGVENPRARHGDVLPDLWSGQVAAVARHEFDDQTPTKLGDVHGVRQCPAGVEVNVQIAIPLVTGPDDRP
jgi:hypothetical protein